MTRDHHQSREDRLIADYFRPLAHHAGAFALEDDAAALTPPPNCDFVLTKDAIVSGIHFFVDDGPGDIARKALRVNLSDLAAKGADPAGFLLALALPANDEPLRLMVDQSLARLYATGGISKLYASWFGEPDETATNFFKWIAVPE